MKCKVPHCKNHSHQGEFVGNYCKPCVEYCVKGEGVVSRLVSEWIDNDCEMKEDLKMSQK